MKLKAGDGQLGTQVEVSKKAFRDNNDAAQEEVKNGGRLTRGKHLKWSGLRHLSSQANPGQARAVGDC